VTDPVPDPGTSGGVPDPTTSTTDPAPSTSQTTPAPGPSDPACTPPPSLPGEMDPTEPLPAPDPVPAAAPPVEAAPTGLVQAAGVPRLGRAPLRVGAAGPRVIALQTRLRWAGIKTPTDGAYDDDTAAAVRLFQAKRRLKQTGDASRRTLVQLLKATKRGDRLDERCYADGKVICVDKTQKVLRFLRNGKVKRQMHINIGPERGDRWFGRYSSTREGSFSVFRRAKYHVSTGYGTPMPYSLWFDGGEAFHLSRWFGTYGYANTSFGCVTVGSQRDARWVFRRTPVGTPFVVYS
jgi:peptidoglycan hydrolase-like protein with peptidoglycan-binding domain